MPQGSPLPSCSSLSPRKPPTVPISPSACGHFPLFLAEACAGSAHSLALLLGSCEPPVEGNTRNEPLGITGQGFRTVYVNGDCVSAVPGKLPCLCECGCVSEGEGVWGVGIFVLINRAVLTGVSTVPLGGQGNNPYATLTVFSHFKMKPVVYCCF